ncbi:hypothetical protein JOM56_004696 [Amanita muscaria]
MRDLLLHLVILQGRSHTITAAQALESNMNETVTEWSPALVTEAQQNIPEKDLDSCLSVLLSCLRKTDLVMVVDGAIIDRMFSLLAFDYAETAARVQTISDAQKLIDVIDLPVRSRRSVQGCAAGVRNFCKSTTPSAVPLFEETLSLYSRAHIVLIRVGVPVCVH